MADLIEAVALDRAADWRIKKVGENPQDAQSAAASVLLQKLAAEVRQARGSAAYTEYTALLNWLGEFDVLDEFAERANAYRSGIGIEHFPPDADYYLAALIAIAKDTAGL